MDLFQTSLYFFSSLLQADAALLGFGTVFIIYKLQSLDSTRQSIIQTYYSKGNTHTQYINALILSKDPKEIARVLLGIMPNTYDFTNYKYIALIPARANQIKGSIKLPVIVISSHAVFCALLLACAQYSVALSLLQTSLIAVTFLWFAWLIVLASRLSISLLTKQDEYDISALLPDVHKEMQERLAAKQSERNKQ